MVRQFCTLEYGRIFRSDKEVIPLCRSQSGKFLPDGQTAVPYIVDLIITALGPGNPLSIVRVGNGEGNAVSMTKQERAPLLRETFFVEFNSQNGISVPDVDAIAFCSEVRAALLAADIIGFRSFRFDESGMITGAIERGDAYAALGILYAREFLQDGLDSGYWRKEVLTTAWLHLDVAPRLDHLLNAAAAVVVITGRAELEGQFVARLGSRLREFIAVPVQGFRPPDALNSHFCHAYPKVRRLLKEMDLRGTLPLVGAGLFGKVYCHDVRESGGVALDLGSAFDVMAGLTTRPIHAHYDLNPMRWLSG
jgi:hypothetical protein